MSSPLSKHRGLKLFLAFKLGVWFALACAAFIADQAHAQGRFLDLSLTGAYSKSTQEYSVTTRRTWTGEIGLPLTSFFEVSLGHTFTEDTTRYNDSYRDMLLSKGYPLPDGTIQAVQRVQDYSVNGDLGYAIRSVRPSIFGGALRRRVCQEDVFEDHGCETIKLSWNAGLALQIYLTQALRFKASWRVSPAVAKNRPKKTYDQQTSVGLSWSL